MWVKQYKPAMTGNGKHTTYTFMVIWFVFVLPTKKKYGGWASEIRSTTNFG